MTQLQSLSKHITITARLLFWFLFLGLAPLTLVTFLSYNNAVEAIRAEVTNNLIVLADSKARQLENYAVERHHDVTSLALSPDVSGALQTFERAEKVGVGTVTYKIAESAFRSYFEQYVEFGDYTDLILITVDGHVVFAVNQLDRIGQDYSLDGAVQNELALVIDRAQTLLQTEISNFENDPLTKKPAAFIAAPILKQGVVLGVVVLQISNQNLYDVVNDVTGLGETGETVVGQKLDERINYVAPSRHVGDALLSDSVIMGSEQFLPMQEAVRGIQNNGPAVDYRGENVLAVWRYLPSLHWGIVVKIDEDEAFASVINQQQIVLLLMSATLVLVVISAVFVSRSISKPIVDLTNVVKRVTKGDLQQKAMVVTNDEIGILAHSFNTMTRRLRYLVDNLEERVMERTQALEANAEISHHVIELRDLDELLAYMVNYLQQKFHFYHIHIYLIEPHSDLLIMVKGSGNIGEKLRERGHQLKVGQGIVGTVASTHSIFLSNNVDETDLFVRNTLLPDTQSELAVPLRKGDQVLGVLDIQSEHINRFSAEDVNLMQSIANQTAIAIDNARLLAERQATITELRALGQAKSQFITMISHELRTPLNAINGFAELLLMGISGDLSEQVQSDVELIHNSGKHLLEIINEILDITQIESGQIKMVLEPIDATEIVQEVIEASRPLVGNKPIKLRVVIDETLPLVQADATRLRQILLNLMSNAAKFTEEGSITITVTPVDTMARFAVIDTGVGIPPDKQQLIFEQFQQADMSDARQYGGMGLGLSISQRLVTLQDGVMGVHSEDGVGSEFFFTIPLVT